MFDEILRLLSCVHRAQRAEFSLFDTFYGKNMNAGSAPPHEHGSPLRHSLGAEPGPPHRRHAPWSVHRDRRAVAVVSSFSFTCAPARRFTAWPIAALLSASDRRLSRRVAWPASPKRGRLWCPPSHT